MASAIRNLTGVGGDVRKIARLLQKKAPPGHMLAYINQEEADLLKSRGGSGKPHADTGVPSFEEEYTEFDSPMNLSNQAQEINLADQYAQYRSAPSDVTRPVDMSAVRDTANPLFPEFQKYLREQAGKSAAPAAAEIAAAPVAAQYGDYLSAPSGSRYFDQELTDRFLPSAVGEPPPAVAAKPDKDLLGEVKDWWSTLQPDTKAKLGIGGVQAVLGAYQAQQAAEQGRQAKEEMQRMAAPYQEQGKRLIAQAQRGELSPAAQQQLQAVQAQAAQGAQARGGVGAQQAQAQVEAFRQQLLQNQYDYGLKVAGIGDQVMMGAIKTGLQADQYVNQLTSNYFNNIARTLYGQPPESAKTPAATGAA